jgi:regulator of sigma E protease
MARTFKVGVNEFAIGMGPKLLTKKSKKTGIVYSIRALPIGGFVSMVGEDEENERDDSLNKKPVWQRFLILVAGSVMNLLFGFLMTAILVGMLWNSLGNTTIALLSDSSVEAGTQLMVGDKIVSINGEKVSTSYDLQYTIMHDGEESNTVKVIRDGKKVTLKGVSFIETYQNDKGEEGARYIFRVEKEDFGIGVFLKHTFNRSVTTVEMIWESVLDLVTGKYGVDQLSGPVGITSEIGKAAKVGDGGKTLINLTAIIALNLGVMNLLPLPALDGGRLLFLVVEGIRRKPIKRELEGYIHFAGLVLFMLLFIFISYKDIVKLFG